jgi:hypothetical protein
MIFINKIPHLKYNRIKTILPFDTTATNMYSMAIVNNNDYNASIEFMKDVFISGTNKYRFYYMDYIYRRKFMGKNLNVNLKNIRHDIYTDIMTKITNVKCINLVQSLSNKDFYFDIFKYNEYFFKLTHGKQYKLKIVEYVKMLKGLIDDPRFSKYKNKVVFMNVESWIDEPFNRLKKIMLDNPILIFYFLMKKDFTTFSSLGDIDFIIYNNKGEKIRLNPSLCNEQSHAIFRREMIKLTNKLLVLEKEDFEVTELKKQDIADKVLNNCYQHFAFTGENYSEEERELITNPEISEEMDTYLKNTIDTEVSSIDFTDKDDDEIIKSIEDKVLNNGLILKRIFDETQALKTGKSTASLKRDQLLRDNQKNLIIKNTSVADIVNMRSNMAVLEENDVSSKVFTSNQNMTKIKYPSFEKVYNEKLFKKDLMNNVMFLNDKSIPVFVKNVGIEDSSDAMNYKETYTFDLEDGNRVRHKLKFDVPKFIDHKFMYLNGNKKIIIKQLYLKPVVKTKPDTVQVCSHYNKLFVIRYGEKLSPKTERFKKALAIQDPSMEIKLGDSTLINNKYLSTIEYDELAKHYLSIKVKNAEFIFNQDMVREKLRLLNITPKENLLCVGFTGDKDPLYVDVGTQLMNGGTLDLVDFILSVSTGKIVENFQEAKIGKKFMYTKVKILKQFLPLVVLLGFYEGLSTVLKKAQINHQFSDKRPTNLNNNQAYIQFLDGYLVYDIFPMQNALLMNGFAEVATKAFNYSDFDSMDVYLSIFETVYGNKMIANPFMNFYEFLIDPITKEILEDLNYPTNFVELLLFANQLLADNTYLKENNMNLYRIRSNEMVNAYLYKALAKAYLDYTMTAHNPNPIKISIPQDKIIKDLLLSQNTEDYSILNPVVELEKSRAITPKGLQGLNVSEAFDQSKRAYDKTMMGILAMSTSPD